MVLSDGAQAIMIGTGDCTRNKLPNGVDMRTRLSAWQVFAIVLVGLTLALATPADAQYCNECPSCAGRPEDKPHKAGLSAEPGYSLDHEECGTCPGCWSSPCPPHQACGASLETLGGTASLLRAARANDMMGVARFLAMPSVRLNPARHAIQVAGCNGAVVTHVELSRLQYAELTKVLKRWDVRLGLVVRRAIQRVALREAGNAGSV